MAKNKSTKTKSKRTKTELATDEVAESVMESFALTVDDRRFLERSYRFLINVIDPRYARVARRHAYDADEHRTGLDLHRTASGDARPLEALFDAVADAGGAAHSDSNVLQEIDAFENRWFPRTYSILRRVVSQVTGDRAKGTQFADVFFHELNQQPLGPSVVGSVRTFLTRLADLSTSSKKGAKEARAKLSQRGLNERYVKHVESLVAQAEGRVERPVAPSPPDLERSREAQKEALESLRLWFDDWATTLRPAFSPRDAVYLGLTVPRGGAKSVEPDPQPADEDEPDADDPEDDA